MNQLRNYSTTLLISVFFHFHLFAKPESFSRVPSFYDLLPSVKKGGMLNYKMRSDPNVMNPILSTDSESRIIEDYIWLPLMTMDPENLTYLEALANNYSISEDKKDYTFTLNPNAKWQDGTPVTTEDIKFTFDKLMDPKVNAAVHRSYFGDASLSIKDKYIFTFHMKDAHFHNLLTLCSFTPIQKKQFENTRDFNKDKGIINPIGNAAYSLSKYERGNKIVLTRNKNWWGYSLPHYKNRFNIDEIVLKILPDENLAYERFIKGGIDNISFTPEQWHVKVTGIDKEKFSLTPHTFKKIWALKIDNKFPRPYTYIAWNEKKPIFMSAKTRRALSYLVNYTKILGKVYYNLAIQSTSPFGSLSLNSAPELRLPENMITYNKEKARTLLKEDGWKNGGNGRLVKDFQGKSIPFEFELLIGSQSTLGSKISQILKEDFKSLGIIVNIKSIEWNSYLDKIEKRDFDALILSWSATLFPNAKQVWHSDSQTENGSNFISYSNPKVDELIKKSNLEFDQKKRSIIMQEINRLIYADQPYTFLVEPKYVLEGINSKIKSFKWLSQYDSGTAADLFYLE